MATVVANRGPSAPTARPEHARSFLGDLENAASRWWNEFGESWLTTHLPAPMDVSETNDDVSETNDAVRVKVDLPGVDADEINIQLNENILTISGERQEEADDPELTYHRIERASGRFSRTAALPAGIDEDRIVAASRDGVLTILLPKAEEAKTRKISVRS